jgi:hypothetical protein
VNSAHFKRTHCVIVFVPSLLPLHEVIIFETRKSKINRNCQYDENKSSKGDRTAGDSFSVMPCVSNESDNGQSPMCSAVMIPPLLQALMRLIFVAFRLRIVRHSLSYGLPDLESHASKYHDVSTRNNILTGPRGNIIARKIIMTYL